jgi:hypothetical protein
MPQLLESLHRELLVRMELYGRVWHDDLAARIGELRRDSDKDSSAIDAEGSEASEPRAAT